MWAVLEIMEPVPPYKAAGFNHYTNRLDDDEFANSPLANPFNSMILSRLQFNRLVLYGFTSG